MRFHTNLLFSLLKIWTQPKKIIKNKIKYKIHFLNKNIVDVAAAVVVAEVVAAAFAATAGDGGGADDGVLVAVAHRRRRRRRSPPSWPRPWQPQATAREEGRPRSASH